MYTTTNWLDALEMPRTNRPPSPLRQVFGANLRAVRKEKGLSIFDIAYSSQMDWSYISQIERGQRNAGIDILDALANAVGVKLVDLLNENKLEPDSVQRHDQG